MTTLPARSDAAVVLPSLTFVEEAEGILIGRPDTGSYALFPPEGADLVRRLGAGETPAQVAAWFEEAHGSPLDIDDLLGTLRELGFVAGGPDEPTRSEPVRWQRAGRALFSIPSALALAVLVASAGVLMIRDPALLPHYRNLFFTEHLTIMVVALQLSQFPCLAVHEAFHALAGRRLGLPSRMSIARRYYYIVAETDMTALHSVRRRQRYLPMFAGTLADVGMVAGFTILSASLARTKGPDWLAAYFLAMAFTALTRIAWQGFLHLETDFYHVAATASGAIDLRGASGQLLYQTFHRVLPARWAPHMEERTERDRRAARWYAPLMVLGYGLSTAMLLLVGIPSLLHASDLVLQRLRNDPSALDLLDLAVPVIGVLLPAGALVYVLIRNRRRRTRRPTPPTGADS